MKIAFADPSYIIRIMLKLWRSRSITHVVGEYLGTVGTVP